MKPEQITEALEQAAAQVGVRVRYESMTGDSAGAGGLCKIRGEWTVIMDRKSPSSDRAAMLVEALAQFDVDAVYLPPEIRQVLAKRRAADQLKAGEAATTKAGEAGTAKAAEAATAKTSEAAAAKAGEAATATSGEADAAPAGDAAP